MVLSQGSRQADTIRQEFEGSHRNVFLLGSQVKRCTVPWLTALPTYFIDEVPDFIRIGWSGTILGHAQVAGSHIVSNHFRSSIQAPMQLAQIKVLEKNRDMAASEKEVGAWAGLVYFTASQKTQNYPLCGVYQHAPKSI